MLYKPRALSCMQRPFVLVLSVHTRGRREGHSKEAWHLSTAKRRNPDWQGCKSQGTRGSERVTRLDRLNKTHIIIIPQPQQRWAPNSIPFSQLTWVSSNFYSSLQILYRNSVEFCFVEIFIHKCIPYTPVLQLFFFSTMFWSFPTLTKRSSSF